MPEGRVRNANWPHNGTNGKREKERELEISYPGVTIRIDALEEKCLAIRSLALSSSSRLDSRHVPRINKAPCVLRASLAASGPCLSCGRRQSRLFLHRPPPTRQDVSGCLFPPKIVVDGGHLFRGGGGGGESAKTPPACCYIGSFAKLFVLS